MGLSLYDIANEDGLPFHLRVFALRLTLWMWTKHSTVLSTHVAWLRLRLATPSTAPLMSHHVPGPVLLGRGGGDTGHAGLQTVEGQISAYAGPSALENLLMK